MFGFRSNVVRAGLAAPMLVLGLAACGSGSDASTSPAQATSAPTARATGQPAGGFGGQNFQEIQQCLSAAGFSIPTPSGGFPTGRPTDLGPGRSSTSDGTPPSGAPNGRGPGSGRRGAFGQILNNPQAQAALKACGITIPTGRPTPTPTSTR